MYFEYVKNIVNVCISNMLNVCISNMLKQLIKNIVNNSNYSNYSRLVLYYINS